MISMHINVYCAMCNSHFDPLLSNHMIHTKQRSQGKNALYIFFFLFLENLGLIFIRRSTDWHKQKFLICFTFTT
jgi:hypothetical protein